MENYITGKGKLLFCEPSIRSVVWPLVVEKVEYGFYPQMAVSAELQEKLEEK